jgi:hypothetical protein
MLFVTPAQAGAQSKAPHRGALSLEALDSRFRGNGAGTCIGP